MGGNQIFGVSDVLFTKWPPPNLHGRCGWRVGRGVGVERGHNREVGINAGLKMKPLIPVLLHKMPLERNGNVMSSDWRSF